ncbi:MAG: ATP-binding protein [Pseudomonadota bacterium]
MMTNAPSTNTLAAHSPCPILQVTAQGNIVWCNTAASKILKEYNVDSRSAKLNDLIPGLSLNQVSSQSGRFDRSKLLQKTYLAAGQDWTIVPLPNDSGLALYGQPHSADNRHNQALDHLVAVSNDGELSFDDRIQRILESAYRYFDLDFGSLCRFEGQSVLVEAVADDHEFLFRNQRLPLEATYCCLVQRGSALLAIHDAHERPFGSEMARDRISLGALLAIRLWVGGEDYGALVFGHRTPRTRPFSNAELRFLELTARWLEYELSSSAHLSELTHREARYRTLYKKTPVMMLSVDCAGRIVEVSDRFLQKLGYTRDSVLGRSYLDFVERNGPSEITDSGDFLPLPEHGRTPDEPKSVTFISAAGIRIETEMRSMPHASGIGCEHEILCVLNDVTAHNLAERELAAANARLQRANEGLQRFNMIASHDLQEPLRKIRAFGSLLESELGHCLAGDAAYALSAMVNASRRLTDLVDDLLALSQESRRQYQKKPVPMANILSDTLGAQALSWDITAQPIVACDPCAVARIIDNFATNACKYAHPDRAPHIQVAANRQPDGAYEIVLADNGIGLSGIELHEMFEPFKRFCDDPGIPGTGTGLAICAAICKQLGWDIGARDRDGDGADFYLRIPRNDVVVAAEEAPPPKNPVRPSEALTDDDIERFAPYSAA